MCIGCLCISILGLRRSVWWGPQTRSIFDGLDDTEKRVGFISLLTITLGGLLLIVCRVLH
jgi:hypothetical protein